MGIFGKIKEHRLRPRAVLGGPSNPRCRRGRPDLGAHQRCFAGDYADLARTAHGTWASPTRPA